MEKERRTKIMVLVTLIVAIIGLTVAFATLSTTLTINGTASVGGATWDIHFEEVDLEKNYASTTGGVELKYAAINGDATINSVPTLTGTSLTGIDVTLTKPSDFVYFGIEIVNDGTIDAKIESIEISDLCTLSSPVESCDWNNDGYVTQDDIDKVNDNISFFGMTSDGDLLKEGDVLEAGESIVYGVYITYGKATFNGNTFYEMEEATELPERDLTFNNLSITINYVQD